MSTTLNIQDLTPQKASFELSTMPGITLQLCAWSLRVKAWAINTYGEGELQKIMTGMQTLKIAEITYFMLMPESKSHFKNVDEYFENIQKVSDEITVNKALLFSMGIGEPEIKRLTSNDVVVTNLPDPKRRKPRSKSG